MAVIIAEHERPPKAEEAQAKRLRRNAPRWPAH
ncbi:hypothetical protein PSN13_01250 [Micromonospora saelicesensis]|uniref:Uncharacterized protein n=1 Tax=Micromonospora saelicesensis TaxID=285676 RepID=A0A328NV32_9ACTN|nr:hypothetical protein PSN13_01250 [Micromonospora saelicesensis]